jgi:hypothetical protein
MRWIASMVRYRSERKIVCPSHWVVNVSSCSAHSTSLGRHRRFAASIANFSSSSSTKDSSDDHYNSTEIKPPPEKRLSLHLQRMQQKELRRQYLRKQQQRDNRRVPQHQPPSARVQNRNDEFMSQRSAVEHGSAQVPHHQGNNPTAAQVKDIMDQLHHDLTILLRQINDANMDTNDVLQATLPGNIPFWALESNHLHENESILVEHQKVFLRTIELQNQLKEFVERKWIRPGTIHRHEFVALVGDLLQIYSCLSSNVNTDTKESNSALLSCTLELIDWIRSPPYGLELSHKQCHAVITVAAKCSQWTTAAQIYTDHIDPDIAGFIPVPVTTASAREFTVAGLYCVARAALKTATLPVENVFDGVTKLTMVSPSDTENCKYSLILK